MGASRWDPILHRVQAPSRQPWRSVLLATWRRSLLAGALAALLALTARSAVAQAVTPAALRDGQIAFAVEVSGAPDFTGRATVRSASFTGADVGAVRGSVEVVVAEMRTGIGLRDRHMRNALEADGFPTIRFDLLGVVPGAMRGDTLQVTYRGRLALHGQTREVDVAGTVVIAPGSVVAVATFPVDLRDYAIEPPSRFFGAIRVQPVVRITARLGFGAAPAGQ